MNVNPPKCSKRGRKKRIYRGKKGRKAEERGEEERKEVEKLKAVGG